MLQPVRVFGRTLEEIHSAVPRVFNFHVIPSLPERLQSLDDLSLNLRWTWDPATIALFRSVDPDVWEETRHNPRLMLSRVEQRRLRDLASDEAFLAQMDRAAASLAEYQSTAGWFLRTHPDAAGMVFAYFSAEFGLTECIPNYAGGLGVLAGDHLKSASDLGLPFAGMGLLYQRGYCQQYLNADGWQQEVYPVNDFRNLPLTQEMDREKTPLLIAVEFPGRVVHASVWKVQVGRVPLYLLDTNVPQNSSADRRITDSLYGGDDELRLQQEIILGIGGLRALQVLGIRPRVCHMNEGHSAFLGLERTRMLMEDLGLTFYEARQLAAAGNIVTTHTSVQAGFDRFDPGLIEKYFRGMADRFGISFDRFLSYGRENPADSNESFNMAFLAARTSSAANGVSRLHGVVTRRMVQPMWPGYSLDEVPVRHVANGVHMPTWTSAEMHALLTRYLGPRWAEVPDRSVWNRVERIPDHELWRVHQIRRERLVHFARRALEAQLRRRGGTDAEIATARGVLNPDALTIGFARRFAAYKRATLLLQDEARINRILTNASRPVQIVVAGKAHPRDNTGKELIRQIVHFSRDPEVRRSLVFLEDYDMAVARHLVQGVDVWLNTPRRPNEASGTSGMKILPNGGLNLSILDGWWNEAYDPEVGWAIGNGEEYSDEKYQDVVESEALYDLLEKAIAPMFYERDEENLPRRWLAKMKSSMKRLCPVFGTSRMVIEYVEHFYLPAARRYARLAEDHGAKVYQIVEWRRQFRMHGSRVKITHVQAETHTGLPLGTKLQITASVFLGDIPPEAVRVQIVSGPMDAEGAIIRSRAVDMVRRSRRGQEHTYQGEIECLDSGSCGFCVRAIPHHEDVIVPYEHPWIVWAE